MGQPELLPTLPHGPAKGHEVGGNSGRFAHGGTVAPC